MITDHRPVPAPRVRDGILARACNRKGSFFKYRSYVCVSLPNVILARSKMAINKAYRRVLNHETRNDRTLFSFTSTRVFK
jgi:hypothetical protein